jgi:hypothetical protein
MKLTRSELAELLAALRRRQDLSLRRTGRGGYRITLSAAATTHADFGDGPLLRASSAEDAAARQRVVRTVTRYTRAFFDRTLRGSEAPLPDPGTTAGLVIDVEEFPTGSPPGR